MMQVGCNPLFLLTNIVNFIGNKKIRAESVSDGNQSNPINPLADAHGSVIRDCYESK